MAQTVLRRVVQLLKFETEVRLRSDVSPAEAMSRLSRLVAPAFATGGQERKKPLRGKLTATGGSIRWPLNERRFASPRNLHFELVDLPDGTWLRGAFKVWGSLRVLTILWLSVAIAVWLYQIGADLYFRRPASALLHDLASILIATCMALGYVWLMVRISRGRDDRMVKILKLSLQSQDSANAVIELLTHESMFSYDEESEAVRPINQSNLP